MTYFIKKIYVAIALLSIISIGYAYGDYQNTSCQPCGCGKGFISAELLYWRAFESGLDTCVPKEVTDIVTPDGTVISTFRGEGRDPHFRWDPGFRIATGYEFACSDWGVAAAWTHFNSRTDSSNNSRLRWNIRLDEIDILAGYDYKVGSCFALMPYAGVRGVRIDQKVHAGEFGSSSSSLSSTSLSTSSSIPDFFFSNRHHKERFSGVGPLFGLEADWNIGCGFSFYANASVSWLYGKFDIRLTEADEIFGGFNFCSVRKRLDAILTAADAGIGIRWKQCVCENMELFFQLGLEHHRYFDFNRIGDCCGDLSFDGLNFSAAIEF